MADSKGRIWIGNNGIGVLLFQRDSVINFSDKNGLIHTNSSKNGNTSPIGTLEHVFAIEEDSEGNIWFGDRDSGAWKYDGRTLKNYSISDTRSKPMIWTIYKDKNGNLVEFLKGKSDPIVDPSQFEVMKANFAITKNMTDDELESIKLYINSFN